MQIELRQASLARPSHRSSAATRLIANILRGTDPVRRRDERPTELPPISHAERFRFLQTLARDPAGNQYTYVTLWAAVLSNRFLVHRRGVHP
jgi:hypothetical protein